MNNRVGADALKTICFQQSEWGNQRADWSLGGAKESSGTTV